MRILDQNRGNYTKSFKDEGGCIFCAADEVLECPGLASKHWRVLVNRFPYMDGNLMIIPARHLEDIADISEAEWQDFGEMLVNVKKVLGEIFQAESFNFGMNHGPESGASISHLHWQVVPRKFKNITVLNTFADLYLVGVTPEETKRRIDEYLTVN
jgi:ATP adenylyltransferase